MEPNSSALLLCLYDGMMAIVAASQEWWPFHIPWSWLCFISFVPFGFGTIQIKYKIFFNVKKTLFYETNKNNLAGKNSVTVFNPFYLLVTWGVFMRLIFHHEE